MPGNVHDVLRIGKSVNRDEPFSTPSLRRKKKQGHEVGVKHSKRRSTGGGVDDQFADWLDDHDAESVMRVLLNHGRLAELYQSATAVGATRVERYREYDVMADSSLMASFLEMLTDDASQQSHENGLTLWPSKTCKYEKEISEFLERINNEELVWGWMYNIAKYGDWFVRPRRGNSGIQSVRDDYHPSEIWRIDVNGTLLGFAFQENVFASNATYSYGVGVQPATIVGPDDFVHFLFNYKPHFDKIRVKLPKDIMEKNPTDDYSWYNELKSAVQKLETEQVKILTESRGEGLTDDMETEVENLLEWMGFEHGDRTTIDGDYIYAVVTARYGSSAMHNARKDHKILNLVEQSMALARLARSPVARVFYVDTSGASVDEREEMVDYIERKFTTGESFDADRDLYKDSYVPLGYLDDIVLPVSGTRGDLKVDQIGGDVDVKSIVDIDYFLNKVFSGIRVPKSFMGYEEMLPGLSSSKSLTTLDIRYARSAKKLQRAYINGMKRLCRIDLEDQLGRSVKLKEIQLEMVSVSSAEESERVDIMTSRIELIEAVADVVEAAGGNKRLAIRDMLQDSEAEFSLIQMQDSWFKGEEGKPDEIEDAEETEEVPKSPEDTDDNAPGLPDVDISAEEKLELPDLGVEEVEG